MSQPPTAYQLETSVSLWQQLQSLLLEDPTLLTDEETLAARFAEAGVPPPDVLLRRLIDNAILCDQREEQAENLRKRYAQRRDRFIERGQRIRATIQQLMDVLNVKAMEAEEGTASLVKGRPSVVITDEAKLSFDYIRVHSEPDKIAIGAALKDGKTVDGAEFSNPGPSLRITQF